MNYEIKFYDGQRVFFDNFLDLPIEDFYETICECILYYLPYIDVDVDDLFIYLSEILTADNFIKFVFGRYSVIDYPNSQIHYIDINWNSWIDSFGYGERPYENISKLGKLLHEKDLRGVIYQ